MSYFSTQQLIGAFLRAPEPATITTRERILKEKKRKKKPYIFFDDRFLASHFLFLFTSLTDIPSLF